MEGKAQGTLPRVSVYPLEHMALQQQGSAGQCPHHQTHHTATTATTPNTKNTQTLKPATRASVGCCWVVLSNGLPHRCTHWQTDDSVWVKRELGPGLPLVSDSSASSAHAVLAWAHTRPLSLNLQSAAGLIPMGLGRGIWSCSVGCAASRISIVFETIRGVAMSDSHAFRHHPIVVSRG